MKAAWLGLKFSLWVQNGNSGSFREGKPFARVRFVPDQLRFFPNRNGPPRWYAYSSYETGNMRQVCVRDFAGTLAGSDSKWQISTDGGQQPHWRGDGRELFYINGSKLMSDNV